MVTVCLILIFNSSHRFRLRSQLVVLITLSAIKKLREKHFHCDSFQFSISALYVYNKVMNQLRYKFKFVSSVTNCYLSIKFEVVWAEDAKNIKTLILLIESTVCLLRFTVHVYNCILFQLWTIILGFYILTLIKINCSI